MDKYDVKIEWVMYKTAPKKHYKVVITFGEEIAERLANNHIDYIFVEPIGYNRYPYAVRSSLVLFYGYNSKNPDKEPKPFGNANSWAKYDEQTRSICYTNKKPNFWWFDDDHIGYYNNFTDRGDTQTKSNRRRYMLFSIDAIDKEDFDESAV